MGEGFEQVICTHKHTKETNVQLAYAKILILTKS